MKNKMPIRAEPFAHQLSAYETSLDFFITEKSRGYALLMEMGCGKSLTSIAVSGRLYLDKKINRVLIVAPVSILGVWEEEYSKFADFDYTLAILTGTGTKKIDTLRHLEGSHLQVAVVNYESTWRIEKELSEWLCKGDSMIICDEGHKLKTHNRNASKAMHRLGKTAKYRLLLTGTIITNKPIDVFSQYKFLNPEVFGNSFYSFRNRYFDLVGYGNHTPVLKKNMEPELTQKIHSIAFRTTKSECLDLPPITDIIRSVDLENSAMKLYKNLVKDSYTELGNGEISATNILTKLLRLSQLTGGFLASDDSEKLQNVSKAKLEMLSEIIETAQENGEKLVVIARFISEINAIKKLLEKKKINYSAISGETKNRAEQVQNFQETPDVTVFIGQIATAGLGITLTAASTLVFYSYNYNFANFEQSKARIHRVGQENPCTYIYLVAKNTIDEKILKALSTKANIAKTLIDNYKNGENPFD